MLAPEHPEVERLAAGTEQEQAVRDYVNESARATAEERAAEEHQKTGVPLGREVTNPVNGERIPMFVADYVLMEYGTGAIMAVPAHDERDYEFARAFDLPIRRVIEGTDPEEARDDEGLPYSGDGAMVNSGRFDGKHNREAYDEIVAWLESEGRGKAAVNYRLRDWLVSRQRYWGAPIPIVYCDECGIVPVPEDQLPVLLPGHRGLRAEGQEPAGGGRGLGADRVPAVRRRGPPRDRHDGHLRRFLLVLPALPRHPQRRGSAGRARSPTTGCRSTSTSAASSTRSCT